MNKSNYEVYDDDKKWPITKIFLSQIVESPKDLDEGQSTYNCVPRCDDQKIISSFFVVEIKKSFLANSLTS